MSDDPDMKTDLMSGIQNLSVPDLAGLGRAAPRASCDPGVHSCGALVTEDLVATTVLHEYLTWMRQDFTAYRDFARSSVQVYLNGQSLTEQEFRSHFAGLPSVDPALHDPAPEG
ncbi:hypothetical protein [Actinophytocola sp. NPDC049390]|uniref:hypothetical protein n=1 Tax=Actinophytocola sp. NPDC049390 TaxID=3363894 RepID=UPI0037B3725A